MCVCINELRKCNGEEYTPRTLSQFIAGIQRYINSKKSVPIRLADPSNPIWKPLHRVLDSRYRDLHAKGVGTSRRQAEVVSEDEEELLWSSGQFSSDSPEGLLKAVFYYNGLNFVLRGGQEHRELKVSQFNFRDVPDPDNPGELIRCVEYTEHGSKNRPGGRHQLNLNNKTVVQYAQPQLGDRCHVFLLELYISKLPVSALEHNLFYMKPRARIPDSASDPWYTAQPMGHNTLDKYLKNILRGAGINTDNKSNHSLRATAISRMYQKNIPEKLIMERSGHLSREGVASYERTTPAQQLQMCKTLLLPNINPPTPVDIKPLASEIDMEKKPDPTATSPPLMADPADSAVKQETVTDPSDIMKHFKFSNLTSCTFNISMK